MPEETVAYLEPIEEEIIKEKFVTGGKQENTSEKSALPEIQGEQKTETKSENETLYKKILSSVSATTPQNDENVDDEAKKVSLKTDADSKVNQLVELASTKGVVYAVKVARHLQDFYVLDQMHDDLVNRLYDSLKEKGLIQDA
jgi:hypothetical protein